MNIITVSGSYSGIGKTRIVTKLLKALKGWSSLKVTVSYKGRPCPKDTSCGACSLLTKRFSIIQDRRVLYEDGKDTKRFKDAGAKKVIWLLSTPEGLKKGLKEALSRFKKTKGLIIEGTRVLEYLNPHLAIFVSGNKKKAKPSSIIALKKADIILESER